MPRPATPPYGERVLRLDPASKGRDVWELQIKLLAWGSGSDPDGIGSPSMPVLVTGTFDPATRDAVKRFQHAVTLPVTGVVNDATFVAIDKEAGLWPVIVWDFRCPCADGKNVAPIRCRCNDHPSAGVCTGFGSARFAGQFLLDNVTLPDGKALASEQLDVYKMREYPGMDKALLWAVRGLMRRANVPRIKVAVGYRCWQDNYQTTGTNRFRHRRSTFHLGRMVELYHDGACAEYGQNPAAGPCATCIAIRRVAVEKCGFQARWQQPNRVSVGEVGRDGPPPFNPFAVPVSTVRRVEPHDEEFVKTFHDSVKPLYPHKAASFSYPINLDVGGLGAVAGLDPAVAPSGAFFANTDAGGAGWYPLGLSRLWHSGVHLYAAAGTEVRAIADGEIVGVRGGEAATLKTLGSRNFVLIKHEHHIGGADKVWYSLYMHLDGGAIDGASLIPWRKKLHAQTVDHVLLKAPAPTFTHQALPAPSRLLASPGFAAGERLAKAGGAAAADPRTALDPSGPTNSQVIQLAAPPNTYVYLTLENEVIAEEVAADGGLANLIAAHDIIGLAHPVRVCAGELIGYVGAAPTDAVLAPHGDFLHLETFSETQLLTGVDHPLVDASVVAQVADRKQTVAKLKTAKLLTGLPNDVLLDADHNHGSLAVSMTTMRGVVLKCPSHWELDWKAALAASTTFGYMADGPRDALGDQMNEYRWWASVTGGTRLPAASTVYHYHPIALLLHLAFP